jgi:asparagine synthase (glutamine-hydrolysing)
MKPIYYALVDDVFLFASEIKVLFASGYVKAAIDQASEMNYLQLGSIPAPYTYFHSVKALEPGSYAVLSGRNLQAHSYWSLSMQFEQNDGGQIPTQQAAILVQEAFIESVTSHLVSDVPVGIFLGGGIDSSAILASARVSYSGPLQSFSIVFPGTPWDESAAAKSAAKYYGTEHQELAISYGDFCESLDDFFSAMDQPTIDGLNTYFMSRAAKKAGYKVGISGIGGDEILGGYSSFTKIPRLRSFTNAAGLRRLYLHMLTYATTRAGKSRIIKFNEMLRKRPQNVPEIWAAYRSIFSDEEIRTILSPSEPFRDMDFSGAPTEDFRSISFCEISRFLIPQLLRDSDIFAMHYGLELRTPFVDHLFLKRVLQIGQWEKGPAFSYKAALFQHLNGFLPMTQQNNKRMGFTLPLQVWLKEALASYAPAGAARIAETLNAKPQYAPYVSGFLNNCVHWSCVWSLYVLEKFRQSVMKHTSEN